MTELDRIAAALAHRGREAGGAPPVLATLMSVAGSAYRGPGARMVVLPDDTTVGIVSGGCLEKDLVAHAAQARARGAPSVVRYDLTGEDDAAPWGLNMGCAAKIEVLLEPCPGGVPGYLAAAQRGLERRAAVVISTLFAGGEIGTHAVFVGTDAPTAGPPVEGPPAEGPLGARVLSDARRVLEEQRSDVVAVGEVRVLHEYLPCPIRLVVCGDGADVAPLARLGEDLGWVVERVGRDAALPELDARTAAVVMTHNYARDLALLRGLLPGRAGYVGLLGPRARTERLVEDLAEGGAAPPPFALQRLHAPVGLDIGAETPEEVALAVVAEVRAEMSGRGGGRLRDRGGPIHQRR